MSEAKYTRLVFGQIGLNAIVPTDCIIAVPQDDGSAVEQLITAKFEVLSQDEINVFYQPNGGGDDALLGRVLKGFVGVKDAKGESVSDDAVREALLKLPYAKLGLVRGYFAMLQGRPGLLEKN